VRDAPTQHHGDRRGYRGAGLHSIRRPAADLADGARAYLVDMQPVENAAHLAD